MKTVLNIIIAFLTIVSIWWLEVETSLPSEKANISQIIALIPFLLVSIYARLHVNEIEEYLNKPQ